MTCIHAYDLTTGLCLRCGVSFSEPPARTQNPQTFGLGVMPRPQTPTRPEISPKKARQEAALLDRLSDDGKARVMALVGQLTKRSGRAWGFDLIPSEILDCTDDVMRVFEEELEYSFEVWT